MERWRGILGGGVLEAVGWIGHSVQLDLSCELELMYSGFIPPTPPPPPAAGAGRIVKAILRLSGSAVVETDAARRKVVGERSHLWSGAGFLWGDREQLPS